MKPTPIHLIVSRLKRLSLEEQIHQLRAMVAAERLHSIRWNELQSLLAGKLQRQINREMRAGRAA